MRPTGLNFRHQDAKTPRKESREFLVSLDTFSFASFVAVFGFIQ